jgi:hypothetical protein
LIDFPSNSKTVGRKVFNLVLSANDILLSKKKRIFDFTLIISKFVNKEESTKVSFVLIILK